MNFSIIFPLFTISLKFLKWEMTKKFFFGWGFSSKRKCQDQSSTVINYRFFSFAFFGRKWFSPPLVTTVKTNTTHPFASVKLQEDVENSRKLPSLDYPGGQLVDSHEDFQLTFFTKIGWLIGRWLDQFRIMPRTAKSWWACDPFSDIF